MSDLMQTKQFSLVLKYDSDSLFNVISACQPLLLGTIYMLVLNVTFIEYR